MKHLVVLPFALLVATHFFAQKNQNPPAPPTALEVDFTATPEGNGLRFKPLPPPLPPAIPGGQPPYYTYHWEFGDAAWSREPEPLHAYPAAGQYEAVLTATLHYDDGKAPKKKKKKVAAPAAAFAAAELPTVFEKNRRALALRNIRAPRAEEEMTLTISYQNLGKLPTDGRIYLFFNEKTYETTHFEYQEARWHFGELPDNGGYSMFNEQLPMFNEQYSTSTFHPEPSTLLTSHSLTLSTLLTSHSEAPLGIITEEMLKQARTEYRTEQAWRFTGLEAGQQRNLFVTLDATAGMLRDTHAFIHLAGVFAPDDPSLAPERFTLEIEIVASHDPNLIAVSDNRLNYRFVRFKKLNYKVRFQNNGEAPAKKIELTVDVPPGLQVKKMYPTEWYPKCPLCPPSGPATRCLDTTVLADRIVFTFRDVYLPGSNQKGVTDYDSTQGFVRYRIDPQANMPKRTFRSRASIVFDKNSPVVTGYAYTRFKPGLSPGLKIGYGLAPDSLRAGYIFLGVSLAPYAPWRTFGQVEVLTGLQGRRTLEGEQATMSSTTEQRTSDIFAIDFQGGVVEVFDDTLTTTRSIARTRGFVSFEVPISVRKNLSRTVGLGFGVTTRLRLDNGDDETLTTTTVSRRIAAMPNQTVGAPQVSNFEPVITPHAATSVQFGAFTDLNLGLVRVGPNLGLRAGVLFSQPVQPFVQVAFEYKL
jgi:PKD domain